MTERTREFAARLQNEGLNSLFPTVDKPDNDASDTEVNHNMREIYCYMIESNILNGCKRAIDYDMTLNFFTKLSKNGLSLSPSFMKENDDNAHGVYVKNLNDAITAYAIEALMV